MPDTWSRRLTTSALIVLLHLPLILYARMLADGAQAGDSLLTLSALQLGLLLGALLLPYLVLHRLGIRWNPERARLGEPTD